MHKLDELLSHSGVKGMKWGVRRDYDRPGGADGKTDPKGYKTPKEKRSKIGKHLDSLKRERQWHQVLKQVEHMTTREINTVKKRIELENDLKSLSKSKMATKKDKDDYLRRHEMSDQELNRKVNRLRAKDSLLRAVKGASKEQREFGIKVVQASSTIGVKYALTKKKPGVKDIFDAIHSPTIRTKQDAIDAGLNIASGRAKNRKVKDAIELAKKVKFKGNSNNKSKS